MIRSVNQPDQTECGLLAFVIRMTASIQALCAPCFDLNVLAACNLMHRHVSDEDPSWFNMPQYADEEISVVGEALGKSKCVLAVVSWGLLDSAEAIIILGHAWKHDIPIVTVRTNFNDSTLPCPGPDYFDGLRAGRRKI